MKDVGFIVCFLLTVYVYSYIQLLAASVFIKFSVSVSSVLSIRLNSDSSASAKM